LIINGFGQERYHLIIDTDGAPDDLRAICMFQSVNEFDILAISTSTGSLSASETAKKVADLATELEMDCPIFPGINTDVSPPWRSICQNLPWSEKPGTLRSEKTPTNHSLYSIIKDQDKKIDFICLGSLTNLSELVKSKPSIKDQLNRVIWYNRNYIPLEGANYSFDTSAANFILSSDLHLLIISNFNNDGALFDSLLLSEIASIHSPAAELIEFAHVHPEIYPLVQKKHFGLWDDLIPVYMLYPELFMMQTDLNSPNIKYCVDHHVQGIRDKIIEILSGTYSLTKHIVFEPFPTEPEQFRIDVQEIIGEVIDKYGEDEWKAVVITNELHTHLGIYSIVGAKMGIMAREYFDVPLDYLEIESLAGNKPPISCLNDGLQSSTGATLGHGTITDTSNPEQPVPEAIFVYQKQKIRISLKPEYKKQVEKDIANGIVKYGNLTDGYWKLIRKLAIQYWKEWDRNEIFEIIEMN